MSFHTSMKRALVSAISTSRHSSRLQSNTCSISNRRLLSSISTGPFLRKASCLSYSDSTVSPDGKDTVKFSLRANDSTRITSAQFLEKVKRTVGDDVPDHDFVIPRNAFNALAAEYDEVLEDVDHYKDKYKRALAETENVRKRSQKYVNDAKDFAIQDFCKDLLEVADVLDLALEAVKEEDLKTNGNLNELFRGVEMTKNILENTFSKHGLSKITPIGEKFDPNVHEAIFQIPREQARLDAGFVARVVKIGYMLKNRPIRAAKVGVVAAA